MYPNLEAEMARKGLTNKECAGICKISEKTFSSRRTGQSEFVLAEMKALQKVFQEVFPNCTLEYLFEEGRGKENENELKTISKRSRKGNG